MNDLQLKGNWNQIKGTIKQKYGEISDDDFARVEGKGDELLGLLQKKTGKSKEELSNELEQELNNH